MCKSEQRNKRSKEDNWKITNAIHYHFGHPGMSKTYYCVKNILNQKGLKELTRKLVKECKYCQENKNYRATRGLVKGYLETIEPFKDISVDIIGPIQYYRNSAQKEFIKTWIFTIQDRCSRFAKLYPLKYTKTEDVILCIKQYLKAYPAPKSILSDNGVQFISQKYNKFCQEKNIKTLYSPRLTPQANGQCERLNSTILYCFRIFKDYKIDDIIQFAERNLNFTLNRAINQSPFEKAFGINQWTGRKTKKLTKKREIGISKNNEENKRRKEFNFRINDKVYTRDLGIGKMGQKWRGPYRIIQINPKSGSVLTEEESKNVWNSVRNIRLFERGQAVVSQG